MAKKIKEEEKIQEAVVVEETSKENPKGGFNQVVKIEDLMPTLNLEKAEPINHPDLIVMYPTVPVLVNGYVCHPENAVIMKLGEKYFSVSKEFFGLFFKAYNK